MGNNKPDAGRMRVAAKAYREAIKALKLRHAEEFKVILGEERVKLGLPRENTQGPGGVAMRLREQLRAAGIEPDA